MHLRYFLAASAASLSMACALAVPAAAQQITSGFEGEVTDETGNAVAGATVTIVDTRTGATRTITTDSSGRFRATNLITGGPYTITASATGLQGQTVENQFLNLQGNTGFKFQLVADAAEQVIIVSGQRASVSQLAIGPGTSFGLEELEAFPSISRDIRDIIRIDPRVSLDRANEVDRISCLGGNDRTNNFSVDGILQADTFGLNGTPFAARNALPIPFDSIRETSVEFAPFDVQYGAFTGCAINVVTKSGGNDFHGTAFYTFRNEDLRGDTAGGVSFVPPAFSEKRWGATLSGPIFKDRLFFFAGYEETDLGGSQDFGPTGGGFPNEAPFVTQEQFDQFSSILSSVYGRESGGAPRSTPESSVRYFGRLDAYITDDQRLEATYQRLEEQNVELDVGGNEYQGLNSFEEEGTVSDYYAVRLYSDWSDNFSTEIRLSRSEVADVQGPLGGGEAQSDNPRTRLVVGVTGPDGVTNGILSDGPGIFRSANQLDQRIDQLKVAGTLTVDDHTLTIGGEINSLKVFNLFAVNATGSLYFSNLTDFANGILSGGSELFPDADEVVSGDAVGADINASPSGDINEAAASFSRSIYSFYAQDQWQITDQLTMLVGGRVEVVSGDAPRPNPTFQSRYGFTNAVSFGTLDPIFLPRVALTYDFENEGFFRSSQLKGGVGIFSGGDPTVWFSNAFSNNGFSTGLGTLASSTCNGLTRPVSVVSNGQFTGFPDCARQAGSAEAAAGLADTQSTDPNIETPTVVRANIGFSTRFGTGDGGFFDDWRLNVDYIYSRFRNPFNFVDLSQAVNPGRGLNGFTVDGRPIYAALDRTDRDAVGCNATLVGTGGTPPVYTNVTAACFNRIGRDDEIQLTNAGGYSSHVASLLLAKTFNRGVFTEGGSVNVNFGYAFTDADERRTNDNSTATSGYDRTAAFDRQNPGIRTSSYESKHNITFALNFKEQFFGDYNTQVGFLFVGRSGRPYSLVANNSGVFNDSASGGGNALVYLPTGVNDANLSPSSNAAAVAAYDDFISTLGCANRQRGGSVAANSCRNDWFFDLDMRVSQQLPGPGRFFGVEDKIELFADFDNLLNFIDGNWNASRSYGSFRSVVDLGVDSQGRYIVSNFNDRNRNNIAVSSSIWRIQVGARYEF